MCLKYYVLKLITFSLLINFFFLILFILLFYQKIFPFHFNVVLIESLFSSSSLSIILLINSLFLGFFFLLSYIKIIIKWTSISRNFYPKEFNETVFSFSFFLNIIFFMNCYSKFVVSLIIGYINAKNIMGK